MARPGKSQDALLAYWNGNPTGVATSELTIVQGTVVFDYSTPAIWQRTSLLDNSAFNLIASANGGTLTAPVLAGATTVTGTLAQPVNPTVVAAAGTTQGTAAALGTQAYQMVSSGTSAAGWQLTPSAGLAIGSGVTQTLYNTTAVAGKLYPDTGGSIDLGNANASQNVPASTGVRASLFAVNQVQTSNTATSSSTLTIASTTGLIIGQSVTGTGIPANTTISTISSGTVVLISATTTAGASGTTLTFGSAWLVEQLNTLG